MSTVDKLYYNLMLIGAASEWQNLYCESLGRNVPEIQFFHKENANTAINDERLQQMDCVIIDLSTGFDNGIACCEQLRNTVKNENFTILLIETPGLSSSQFNKILESSADDILPFPFNLNIVITKIKILIKRKRQYVKLLQANSRLSFLSERSIQELHELNERYAFLLDTSRDAVFLWRVNSDGTDILLLDANDTACRMLHFERDAIMKISIYDLLPENRRTALTTRVESILTHRQLYFETILQDKFLQPVPVAVHARVTIGEAGQLNVITVMKDMRISPLEEQKVLENKPAFRQLVNHTGQIVYDYEILTSKIELAGSTTQVTGYKSDEIKAFRFRDWVSIIHPEDRRDTYNTIMRNLETVGKYQIRYRLRHKSGDYRHIEDIGVVLPDDRGEAYRLLGTIKDVTTLMLAELEEKHLEQNKHNAQRLESLGVLAGGIAHDFNNILAAIIGLTDMAVQDLPEGSITRDDLKEVLQAAHRAKELVKQILAFSRQSGEERSPVFLHVVVREALQLLRASLPANIEIIDSINVHTSAIHANSTQIHQVVMNYCTNAAHAMRKKGGRLEVRLEDVLVAESILDSMPQLRPGKYVKLSISDTGHGMEPELLERIFDPFFSTKGPGEGTGMGLAVVHGIVSDHGGAVDVKSIPGQGTVFYTYFPGIDAAKAAKKAESTDIPSGTERILLVDDEETILRFGEAALQRLGYTVKSFSQPEMAIQYYYKHHKSIDLIITDQMMPKMMGTDLARAIKEVKPDIPVILFTGFSRQNVEEENEDLMIDTVVMKPLIAKELAQAIRTLLDSKSKKHENA